MSFKDPSFNDRLSAAAAAKEKALAKLRDRAAPDPALVAERQAAAEARATREAEKRAARKAAQEAAAEARRIEKEARLAALPKPKPAKTPEELKAARDARYAARKARK